MTDTEILNALEALIAQGGGSQVWVSTDVWAREGQRVCVFGERGASLREIVEAHAKKWDGK